MKVIQEGSGKRWWNGEQVTCKGCGRVVELEEGDTLAFAGKESISFKCDVCKEVTDLKRTSQTPRDMSVEIRKAMN